MRRPRLRRLIRDADRRVLTTAAVAVVAIGALSAVTVAVVPENSGDGEDTTAVVNELADSSVSSAAVELPPMSTPPALPPTSPSTEPPPDLPLADIPPGPLNIPGIAMQAYQRAEARLATEQPACHLGWTLLAGIGQVESQHGSGRFFSNGNTIGRILGPRLDGSLAGTAVIKDTDQGRLDGDPEYDRAVGPVQFIPSTWARLGRDATDDGFADPNNIFDSALSTATLLCSQGGSMGDPAARTRAILAYNNSLAYVANVNAWAHGYDTNAVPLPSDLPPIHIPKPEVEPPKIPEKCPEGQEGTPTATPVPTEPGTPEPPIPGCTPVPTPSSSTEATSPSRSEPKPAPTPEGATPVPGPPPFGLPPIELPCLPPFCVPPAR